MAQEQAASPQVELEDIEVTAGAEELEALRAIKSLILIKKTRNF